MSFTQKQYLIAESGLNINEAFLLSNSQMETLKLSVIGAKNCKKIFKN